MTEVLSGSRSSSPLVVDGPDEWQPGLLSSASITQEMESAIPPQTDRQDNISDPGLDDDQCSTKSMTDDVLNYQYLDDRAYHSRSFRSIYWAPNDELQSEAMGLCHSLFCEASNGKLFLAELPDNAQKILDVGTGTGPWAIEVGEAHPHALVIGTDLSPIQPQHVPPNVEFQIDDFNEPWTFKDNSLDYINMRFLTGSVRDWKFLVGEAYRCLKEDGILESSEPSFLIESDDGTVDQTSAWDQWHGVFEEYGAQIGQTFSVVQEGIQRQALEEAHFSDIRELDYKIPIGKWPRDPEHRWLGRCAQSAIGKDALGFLLRPCTSIGWSIERIEIYIAGLEAEMVSGITHPWFGFKKVWGRKVPPSSVVQ